MIYGLLEVVADGIEVLTHRRCRPCLITVGAAQPGPLEDIGIATYLQVGYTGSKNNLLETAEKMPASEYGFRPSEMPEMRTFSRVLVHAADAQFGVCSTVRGVPNPRAGQDLERDVTAKADVIALLREAGQFCDAAFSSLTEANAKDFIERGRRRVARSALLFGLLAHDSEMYGISTVYLRAKNIVPPSTERQQRRQGNR